jgi:hypothetical protein
MAYSTTQPSDEPDARPLELRTGAQASADAIWQLLLDTGFLYPEKLAHMRVSAVRATLSTLLAAPDDVFKVLVAARGEQLEGHVSCVRVYERTWLCQHFAALQRTGSMLATGRQVAVAMLDTLVAAPEVEFIRIRYRPDNPWPAREFGGCARMLEGHPLAQLRTYAYLVSPPLAAVPALETSGSRLGVRAATAADAARIEACFAGGSDALLLRTDDLGAQQLELRHMAAAYARVGLSRRREVLVAERSGQLAGFALLEQSSLGLNYSELTNAVRVYAAVGDSETLQALARAALARYRTLGYDRCVALASDAQLAALQPAGFTRTKDYACFTLHRSLIPELRAYLLRTRKRGAQP